MRKINAQSRWTRLTGWLLLAAFLVSSSTLAVPAATVAASDAPEQFGSALYLPTLSDHYCSGTRPQTGTLGTQLYGASGASRSDFNLLQGTQTPWIRVSINWRDVEPVNSDPSGFNWQAADRVVRAAEENCANLIATIDETAAWASINSYRSPIKTEFLDDYRDFVVAVVDRYNGDGINDAPSGIVINYWEFYNEPDFGNEVPGHEGWGEFGARYAEMLATVYDAVHQTNPNARVLLGGIAYNNFAHEGGGGLFVRSFFQEVLDAGGADHFDIMNFHYYPFQHNREVWTQGSASGLREKVADIYAKLEAKGHGDKPFMITEIGWHSEPLSANSRYPSDPEYQARRVVELMTQAKALESLATIWWAFNDLGKEFPYATGLVTSSAPPAAKPAYDAYVEMLQRVGAATFDGDVVLPSEDNDLEAYRFREAGSNKTFYVAWLNPVAPPHIDAVAAFNDGDKQPLQVDGSSAHVYNKDGTLKQTLKDGGDGANDGKITVEIGRSPLFIMID